MIVTPTGSKSFRFDYRFNGKRQTLTIGQYESGIPNRGEADPQALEYGAALSLKDARALPVAAWKMGKATPLLRFSGCARRRQRLLRQIPAPPAINTARLCAPLA